MNESIMLQNIECKYNAKYIIQMNIQCLHFHLHSKLCYAQSFSTLDDSSLHIQMNESVMLQNIEEGKYNAKYIIQMSPLSPSLQTLLCRVFFYPRRLCAHIQMNESIMLQNIESQI